MNILSGNGEHALHIIAQSKAIWNAELSSDRESPVQVSETFEQCCQKSIDVRSFIRNRIPVKHSFPDDPHKLVSTRIVHHL